MHCLQVDIAPGLVVTAKNADAVHYKIDVAYDGTWWPDSEVWRHLVIGQPHRVAV